MHDIVYAGIDDARREALHGLVANVAKNATRSALARALHLTRAGNRDAVTALADAARLCERAFDDPAAADLAAATLRLCSTSSDPALRRLAVDMAVLASRAMRSREQAPACVALIGEELARPHPPEREAMLRCCLAEQLNRSGRRDDAISALKQALGAALTCGDQASILRAYFELGRIHSATGEPAGAVAELREGLDMVTLGEGPRARSELKLWRYLLKVCEIHRSTGDLVAARTWSEHALWQAETTGDRLGMLRCHAQMAWVLRDQRQLALGEQHLARALDEARHFGDRLATAELLIERARARAARGRLPEARRCCEEALRLARGIQWEAGIDHAERAIGMLTRKSPTARAAGSESSGVFPRPDDR
jgi:serine/threonine-protein kinase